MSPVPVMLLQRGLTIWSDNNKRPAWLRQDELRGTEGGVNQ